MKRNEREKAYRELVETIVRMGYPESFGTAIAENLRTEKTMSRMIGYLCHARPGSAEEIADEMLAIMEDRERWIRKKSAQFYNSRYNGILNDGLVTWSASRFSLWAVRGASHLVCPMNSTTGYF